MHFLLTTVVQVALALGDGFSKKASIDPSKLGLSVADAYPGAQEIRIPGGVVAALPPAHRLDPGDKAMIDGLVNAGAPPGAQDSGDGRFDSGDGHHHDGHQG